MTTQKNETNFSENEEIDLLDLLLALSKNIKTLVILPLFGTVLAICFIFWQNQKPKIFVSHSSLVAEAPTAKNEKPKIISEVLISQINFGDAMAKIKQPDTSITASLSRSDRLVNLTVSAPSPESAQALNHQTLQKIFEITAPNGVEAQRLQKMLKNEQERLLEIHKMLSQTPQASKASPENIRAYGELLAIASARELSISNIESELAGLSPSDVVIFPTFPASPQPAKKLLPLVAGILGGGFLALLWIFSKHAVCSVKKHPEQRFKFEKLKENLSFKR